MHNYDWGLGYVPFGFKIFGLLFGFSSAYSSGFAHTAPVPFNKLVPSSWLPSNW